jgi:hypothetical protein
MIWREGAKYPGQVAAALLALLTTSTATIAIPARFKSIVDEAFGPHAQTGTIDSAFHVLLAISIVLGFATAIRFYFVSWLGERVVADIRRRVQANLLRLPPAFFEVNSPKEIASRMTADTAIIEQVVGTTLSIALRNTITALGACSTCSSSPPGSPPRSPSAFPRSSPRSPSSAAGCARSRVRARTAWPTSARSPPKRWAPSASSRPSGRKTASASALPMRSSARSTPRAAASRSAR